jgi:hypothetical protein
MKNSGGGSCRHKPQRQGRGNLSSSEQSRSSRVDGCSVEKERRKEDEVG